MANWHDEIIQLHEFFEAYFLGTVPEDDLSRMDAALSPGFTHLGPHGAVTDRAGTIAAVRAGYAHTQSLEITITEASVLAESDGLIVCRYVENHALTAGSNHRWSTAAFVPDDSAPNGLAWVTVHETWVEGTRAEG